MQAIFFIFSFFYPITSVQLYLAQCLCLLSFLSSTPYSIHYLNITRLYRNISGFMLYFISLIFCGSYPRMLTSQYFRALFDY